MTTTMTMWIVFAGGIGVFFLVLLATWREHRQPPELRGDWWPRFESEFRAYAKRARDRQPPELRGDWWPRFESEFRAYAKRAAKPAGETRHRKPDKKSPPR